MKNHLTLIACLAVFVGGCSFMGDVSRAVGGMYNGIGDAFDKEGRRREAARAAKNSNKSNQGQLNKAVDTTNTQNTQSTTKDEKTRSASHARDTFSSQGTGEIADLGKGQFDISAAGGLSGNRSTTYAKWDRTAKLACKGSKYKIIKREWQSTDNPGILGGTIECANKKNP